MSALLHPTCRWRESTFSWCAKRTSARSFAVVIASDNFGNVRNNQPDQSSRLMGNPSGEGKSLQRMSGGKTCGHVVYSLDPAPRDTWPRKMSHPANWFYLRCGNDGWQTRLKRSEEHTSELQSR